MSRVWAVVVGAATGILSGMGIGGGTLLMLWLLFAAKADQLAAQGLNLIYFLPTAAAGLVSHVRARRIRLRVFLLCAGFGLAAAFAGSRLALAIETAWLRRIFGGLLIAAGVMQFVRAKKG